MLTIEDKHINLRGTTPNDRQFLRELYGEVREDELNATAWPQDFKDQFVNSQFEAQDSYYRKNYLGADFYIINFNNMPVGRLYYHEDYEGGIRIIDLAILKKNQKKGVGTTLMKSILKRAQEINKHVTIHVESFNPAMRWYKTLGFQFKSETNGVYHLLEWKGNNSLN